MILSKWQYGKWNRPVTPTYWDTPGVTGEALPGGGTRWSVQLRSRSKEWGRLRYQQLMEPIRAEFGRRGTLGSSFHAQAAGQAAATAALGAWQLRLRSREIAQQGQLGRGRLQQQEQERRARQAELNEKMLDTDRWRYYRDKMNLYTTLGITEARSQHTPWGFRARPDETELARKELRWRYGREPTEAELYDYFRHRGGGYW